MRKQASDGHQLRIGLLGPLSVEIDGVAVEVPGTKRRAVLALLALGAPGPVSSDHLVDAIWPDDPPASGRAALQSHVSRLRRHLGDSSTRLTSSGGGYRLTLLEHELDVNVARRLLCAARKSTEAEPAKACALLREAVALWRGAPLAELAEVERLAAWARVMTEEWLDASNLHSECLLRCGDAAAAARAATDALAIDPLREATALNLMRALLAQGRTADALRAAHTLRTRMREQTGLDPSPAVAELEWEIAAGPPARVPSPPPSPTTPPPPASPLFGRDAELTGLARLIASERLVTIVGPGGVGKTRLAIELARRHATTHDVTLVELAPVTDPAAVPDVLARALGVEAGSGDSLDRCVFRLQQRRHLLVLDNCEHILGAAQGLVVRLLAACPDLTVLATSRERLSVVSEQTSELAPLPMPGARDGERVETVPSVALFLERAGRVRPGFADDTAGVAAVARIVRALDGLPLAIELAASRVSSMNVDDIEARLDRALDLFGGPAVDSHGRHRTLRTAVQWSYDLLTPGEQRLFRHLAAFPGGFDLPTAEGIGRSLESGADPATMLAHLVDCSMVVADLSGATRYRMLDTLRSFGLDQLAATDELATAQLSLLRWAVTVASELDAAYETEAEPAADRRLRVELPNLRAAWRLARDTADLDAAAALAVNLYSHAAWRELTELFRWSLELADDPSLGGHPSESCVLAVAAEAAWNSAGDLERAEALARRAVAALTERDERGHALAKWALADVYFFLGRYDESAELSISARQGTRLLAEGYAQASLAAAYGGDLERAHTMARESSSRIGGPTLRAYARYIDGELANIGGKFAVAKTAYRESIEMARAVGASFIVGIASVGSVTAQAADGDITDALAGYRALIDLWERTGAWTQQWTTLRNLAALLTQLDDTSSANAMLAAADRAPEAAALADTERVPLTDPASAAANRDAALKLAREAIARALQHPCTRSG